MGNGSKEKMPLVFQFKRLTIMGWGRGGVQ
jgi:hypothetical protein